MSFINNIRRWFVTSSPTLPVLGTQRRDLGLPTTTLDDIKVIGDHPASPCPSSDVDSAEAALGVQFPHYYREYVCRFGRGTLGGAFVRVYPPHNVRYDLSEFRERISEYWFWGDGHLSLPKTSALEAIRIADTLQGDEVIFHPADPSKLFCLARGGPPIHFIGPDLLEAIDWLCSSGVLTPSFREREFKPS